MGCRTKGPLTPAQARNTLAARLGAQLAPKLRQLNTSFGLRPYRCFLVWTKWTGLERGEGEEHEHTRIELLPTPNVQSMDSVAFSILSAGTLPVGSVRLTEIAECYTHDQLTGHMVPVAHGDSIPEPYSFYYEIVEDGRGDPCPVRAKFRLAKVPMRRAGKMDWSILLERISTDNERDGKSAEGHGTQG